MLTIRELITELLKADDLEQVVSITTDSNQDVGWTDFVVGCVDLDNGMDIPELQCVPRP